jgi:hypothetical protein
MYKRFQNRRDALLGRGRADPVGDLLHALVGVRDRDAVARPRHQLDVVLAVAERDRLLRREPELLREEAQPGALGDARGRKLEEVRQRLRDVEPVAEALAKPGR